MSVFSKALYANSMQSQYAFKFVVQNGKFEDPSPSLHFEDFAGNALIQSSDVKQNSGARIIVQKKDCCEAPDTQNLCASCTDN